MSKPTEAPEISARTQALVRSAVEYANEGCYSKGTPVWRDRYEAYIAGAAAEAKRAEPIVECLEGCLRLIEAMRPENPAVAVIHDAGLDLHRRRLAQYRGSEGGL